jgi:type II secretory pathway component PulM
MRAALHRALAERTPREQVLLALLAALAVGWAFWAGALQPLHRQAAELEAQLHRHTLAIARVAALPPAIPQEPPVADDRPLPVIVTDTAAAAGLDLHRLQERDGAVTVQIDAAGFDAVVLWIEALEQRHGLKLAEATLTALDPPGTVSATLTVTR